MKTTSAATLLALIIGFSTDSTLALPTYRDKIPNPDGVSGVQALGHIAAAGGGPRNQFGIDFATEGHVFTEALCKKDSDGDGQSNGVEMG